MNSFTTDSFSDPFDIESTLSITSDTKLNQLRLRKNGLFILLSFYLLFKFICLQFFSFF